MQTQWSWVLQLCYCVEQHLKENTTYFEVGLGGSLFCVLLLFYFSGSSDWTFAPLTVF